jgi:serine/threonine protein kinase
MVAEGAEEKRLRAAPGMLIDNRYLLTEPLGEGGMGEVWAATHRKLARSVAIKFVDARSGELTERLVREARILASIRHPAVVEVFDVADSSELGAFVVMEHVGGEGLDALVAKGALSVRRTVELFIAILEGLSLVHAQGIVHRDIKPSNILVDGERAKLIDFGIAIAANTGGRLTQVGGIIGTPAYMAPEQVRAKTVDHRADIWSVAVTMLETMTGKTLFEGEDPPTVMAEVLRAPIKRPTLPTQLDDALWAILERAMKRDVEQRLQTAAAFRDQLKTWLAGAAPTLPQHVESARSPSSSEAPSSRSNEPGKMTLDALIRARLGDS